MPLEPRATEPPPGIADRYWRTARRLFGVRSEGYAVADEMPALLLAQDVRRGDGLSDEAAALVACDVFPAADRTEVVRLLAGTFEGTVRGVERTAPRKGGRR